MVHLFFSTDYSAASISERAEPVEGALLVWQQANVPAIRDWLFDQPPDFGTK